MRPSLENLHNLSSNFKKKAYSPLKVLRLGSLTQLTLGSLGGNGDGQASMSPRNQSISPARRRQRRG
jgi:hypothetical protein